MKTDAGITLAVLVVSLLAMFSLHFAMSRSDTRPPGVSTETTASIPAR